MGHPTLNANSRAAAAALHSVGLVREFHTAFAVSHVPRFLPAGVRKEIGRRALPQSINDVAQGHPWPELLRLGLQRVGTRPEVDRRLVDSIYARIDSAMARRLNPSFGGVYAYEDGAIRAFRRAASLGLARIYDLPIGYWRVAQRIFEEEAAHRPEWATTLPGLSDSPRKLAQKDEELRLASMVVVASSFVRDTLAEYPGKLPPVSVIPYGATDSPLLPGVAREERIPGPLRALFVGGLSQRKGLSYVFEALDEVDRDVRLTVVGRRVGASRALDAALDRANVRWLPSLSHGDVLREMRRHDVLLFPSLFEGFGLVLTEALAQGLPVIATPHTAAPDVIRDGEEGWIVPIRSARSIAEKMSLLAERPDLLLTMKYAALSRASELEWTNYERAVITEVSRHLSG